MPYVFFSAVTQIGLNELKDVIWENINKPVEEI
jgi:hypothetical protein